MIEQFPNEEHLDIIKAIESDPTSTQRALSEKIGISLGKTNYLLKELIKKGLIKTQSFSVNPGKISKIRYILTQKGFRQKMCLLNIFLKKKEAEYNLLKQEWEKLNNGK